MSYSNSGSAITVASSDGRAPTRILIVDNQSLSSELLRSQLKPEPNIVIIGTAYTEKATFKVIDNHTPDVVIIDFDVPELNGFALVKRITDNYPQVKSLVFTSENQLTKVNRAIALGAKGFLIKNSQTDEVKSVLRTVTSDRSSDTKLQLPVAVDPQATVLVSNEPILEAQLEPPLEPQFEPDSSAIVRATEAPLPAIIAEREDWSVATKDLMDALPRVWTRGLLYFLIVGTGILLPWSVLTKVDQTGTARGRLEPKNKVVQLDAPVAAKIKAINVKEGEEVKKGAILAELGAEVVSSELEQLQDKRSGLVQRLNQLELMKNQRETALINKDNENSSRNNQTRSQIAQARQNLNTLNALYESQKSEKQAQIDQAKQAIESSDAARKEAQLALSGAQEKASRYEAAYQEGVIAQDRFLDIQQQAKENQERLAQATSAVAQSRSRLKEQESSYENLVKNSQSEIAQAKLRIEELESGGQGDDAARKNEQIQVRAQIQELESQIAETKTEIAQTDKQIKSGQFEIKQRLVIAPADGTVFDIPTRGAGSVVQPGENMIKIAPQDSNLILKAQIPPTDSGFLKKGMPVKVKFDAYPFQDYGVSEGTLISISPDSKVTETPQGPQETYELKVELDEPFIMDEGKKVQLTPGQTATAEIVIRQRRVIDFFIDPFKKLQKDGVKL